MSSRPPNPVDRRTRKKGRNRAQPSPDEPVSGYHRQAAEQKHPQTLTQTQQLDMLIKQNTQLIAILTRIEQHLVLAFRRTP